MIALWLGAEAGSLAALVGVAGLAWAAGRRGSAGGSAGAVGGLTVVAIAGLAAGIQARAGDAPWPDGQEGELVGVVSRVEGDGLVLVDATFDGRALQGETRASCDWMEEVPAVGRVVRLRVTLEVPRVFGNPSPYPNAVRRPWARAVTAPSVVEGAEPRWTTAWSLALRDRIDLPRPGSTALFRALLLGDRSGISAASRWAYQATGTAHLLAISGFNLAVVGWAIYRLMLRGVTRIRRIAQTGRPYRWAAVVALAVTGLYAALIAPSDATDRAVMALGFVFGAQLLGRRASGWRSLAWCFLVAVGLAPEAVGHPGFQLSYAATAALIAVIPTIRAATAWLEVPGRVPHPLLRKLAIGLVALVIGDLAAFLVTAPLGLAWFAQLPLGALLVNLVAIPAMGLVVFPAGLVWLVVALVWPWLGDLLAPVVSAIGAWFDAFILTTGEALGTPAAPGWPVLLGVLGSLGALGVLVGGRWRWPGFVTVVVAACTTLVVRQPAGALEVWALDVGHGDALVVRTPTGGVAMIDAGGSPRSAEASRSVAERVVGPALGALGIGHIDLMVITHGDQDHVGAAADVARRVPVRELWISPCGAVDPRVAPIVRTVEAGGGIVRVVARQAPMSWDGVALEVLWPPPDARRWDSACRWSANDAAIVLRLGFAGRHVLLTGDIEAAAEAELVRRDGDGLRADVLKVPHHGSKTSSGAAFLARVRPDLALVSGELGHLPMPPHPAVFLRYAQSGIRVHTTGTRGAARVRIGADGLLAVDAPFRPEAREALRPP